MMRASFVLAAALASLPVVAQAQAAPAFPPPPPIAPLKPFALPAGETYTLPNGMVVTLIAYGLTPRAIVGLRIEAGEVDAASTPDLGALTAAMLKEGAAGRSALQIAEAAAGMGGDLTVNEGLRGTEVTLTTLSSELGAALALIGDVVQRPTLPGDALDRVKANRLRELAVALSDANTQADYALGRALYPDHPYGAIPDPAQIKGYSLADVRAFHAANFAAGRAHLTVVGRFDAEAARQAIAASFGSWQKGFERHVPAAHPVAGPQVVLVDRPGAPQSTLRVSFPVPPRNDPDDAALEVTDALLGGAFSSRITLNIRENKGYTYSPYSTIWFAPDLARWTQNADVTTAVTGASLHEIWGEIRKLQAEAPGAAEATGIKTYLAGLFTLEGSSPAGLQSLVNRRDSLGLPRDWLDGYVARVLAVTPAAISATARARLTIPTQTLVLVGDLKTVVPQLRAQSEMQGAAFKTVTVP